jgi:hypothetical protein
VNENSKPRRTGRFMDMGFDLHYRNMAYIRSQDVILPNVAGAGSSLVGNLLLELGLPYVDLNRDTFLPDGSLVPPTDPVSRRIRTGREGVNPTAGGGDEPRFMKTHLPLGEFEGCEFGRIWLIVRDPRDAIFSWHQYHRNFGELDWERVPDDFAEFLRRPFFLGTPPVDNWWSYYEEWLDHAERLRIPLEVIRFEDMKSDPVTTVRRLLRSVSKQIPDSDIERACRSSSYETMREREGAAVAAGAGDPAVRVMRRGQVGEWKTWMTDELHAYFSGDELTTVAARLGYQIEEPVHSVR